MRPPSWTASGQASVPLARHLSVLGVGVGLAASDFEKLKGLVDEKGTNTQFADDDGSLALRRVSGRLNVHLSPTPTLTIHSPA